MQFREISGFHLVRVLGLRSGSGAFLRRGFRLDFDGVVNLVIPPEPPRRRVWKYEGRASNCHRLLRGVERNHLASVNQFFLLETERWKQVQLEQEQNSKKAQP